MRQPDLQAGIAQIHAQLDQLLRISIGQRLPQQRVQRTETGGIDGGAKRQQQHQGNREAGRNAHGSPAVVVLSGDHGVRAHRRGGGAWRRETYRGAWMQH
jgi:hypothetical protein